MSSITEKSRGRVQRVQAIVREKTGLELAEQEVIDMHLLALEPAVLARTIVFSLTGNVLDLAEDGDDEREARTVSPPQTLRTS
jgi:hypothetical protein